jgi:hypothetical protein
VLVDFTFIALWCIFPIFWWILLHKAGLSLFRISIPSFLIILILLQQYLGLPALYFELDSYRASLVGSPTNTLTIFAYSSLVTTILLFGFILGRKTMGAFDSSRSFNSYYQQASGATRRELIWIVFLLVVGMLVLIRYIQVLGIEDVALFAALDENTEQLQVHLLRSAMGNDFQGSYHWYHLFMRDLLTLSSMSLYANYLVQSGRVNLFLFGISFIAVSLSTLIATEKGPFLWFLVSLFMVHVLVLYNGVLFIRKLPAFIIPILVVVSVLYVIFLGVGNYADGFFLGLSRVFLGGIAPLATYLDTFPDKLDFLYGSSFANPGEIFPFEHYRLTVEMSNLMRPDLADLGIVSSSPTFFWGEMHANFGFGGIVISSFLVGYVLYAIANLIARFPPSPIVVGFTVWGIGFFSELSKTSLSNYFPSVPFFFLILVSLIGLFISGRGKVRIATGVLNKQVKSLYPNYGM